MTSPPTDAAHPEIHQLGRAAADSADEQLQQVVRTVDALASRGHADALIAPLRPRLAEIHVAHPLRFARLLFLPLDVLIVSPARWQQSDHTLPRSIVLPLMHIVEIAMGKQTAEIKGRIRAHSTADTDVIDVVGPPLWSEAAKILASPDLEMTEQWQHTAMSDRMFHVMRRQVAALLRQAPALDTLVRETASGLVPPDPWAITAMARAISTECPDTLAMFAVMLVNRHAEAASVLYELGSNRSLLGLREATEQAADLLLERLESSGAVVSQKDLTAFTGSVQRIATLLGELDHDMAPRSRRDQIRDVRSRLERDCQVRLTASVTNDFIAPLQASISDRADADAEGLEETARALRLLETVGRSIGSTAVYQAIMAPAADAIEATPPMGGIRLADRVRLLEILAGPDRALALLERDGRAIIDDQ
jgi:hypothetical protein